MARLKQPGTGAVTGVEVAEWRDAIRAACNPLSESETIEDRYVEHCIEIVEEHGPYIVLAPRIALAHARPGDGVKRLCLAVATLSAPVDFGHPENDPVDIVFAFGSPDTEQHIGLLSALADHLTNGLDQKLRLADDSTANSLLKEVIDDIL